MSTPKESPACQFLIDTLPIRITLKSIACFIRAHSNRHSPETSFAPSGKSASRTFGAGKRDAMYAANDPAFGTMRVSIAAVTDEARNQGDEKLARKASSKKRAVSKPAPKSNSAAPEQLPKQLKVGLIGFGTVGRSVAKILAARHDRPRPR